MSFCAEQRLGRGNRGRREIRPQPVGLERGCLGRGGIAVDQRLRLGGQQHGAAAVGGVALDLPRRFLRVDQLQRAVPVAALRSAPPASIRPPRPVAARRRRHGRHSGGPHCGRRAARPRDRARAGRAAAFRDRRACASNFSRAASWSPSSSEACASSRWISGSWSERISLAASLVFLRASAPSPAPAAIMPVDSA